MKQIHIQRHDERNAIDHYNSLSTIRITIEVISEDQLKAEKKLDEALYKAGIEMPDSGVTQYDIHMPLTDPGIVQFEKEIGELCRQYNNTKWY